MWTSWQQGRPLSYNCIIRKEHMAKVDRYHVVEMKELIEDALEFFCDDNMISGEMAWTMVLALAEAKLNDMRG